MIVFNKNSWHYRFAHFWWYKNRCYITPTPSLCPYIREVFGGMLKMIVFSTLALSFVAANIFGIALCFAVGLGAYAIEPEYGFFFGLNAVSLIAPIVTVLVLAGLYFADKAERIIKKRKNAQYDKPPSIFMLWYRSVKDKVCPRIKFTD